MTTGPRHFLAVAAGGASGALARYAATQAQPDGGGFPWTTFAINVVGSALLAGLLLLPLARRSTLWAAALGPGVLGGFTTFSATSEQARVLLADGRAALAGAYVLGTLAAGLVAVVLVGSLAPPLPAEDEL
ncbi:MAG TPA: CrcB family protein [Nocardioides sp.]|nr:CrcB family protein [Nocardioides sp.]